MKEIKPPETKPQFFDLAQPADQTRLDLLFLQNKILSVVDDYHEQLLELFQVKNPSLVYTPDFKEKFEDHLQELITKKALDEQGLWVYFAWSGCLSHILPETDFRLVRTARNRNLITEEEQDKFYNATIGIGGLSVGSSVAFALALQGGAKHIKLADMDRLALSNTN